MKTQTKHPNHYRVLLAAPHVSKKWGAVVRYQQPALDKTSKQNNHNNDNNKKVIVLCAPSFRTNRNAQFKMLSLLSGHCFCTMVQSDQMSGIACTHRHSETPYFRHTCGYIEKGVIDRLSIQTPNVIQPLTGPVRFCCSFYKGQLCSLCERLENGFTPFHSSCCFS